MVYLYFVPDRIEVEYMFERLQVVYLKTGGQIGLIPVKYAESSDYGWYQSYLEEVYTKRDYFGYVCAFEDVKKANDRVFDALSRRINTLINATYGIPEDFENTMMTSPELYNRSYSIMEKIYARAMKYEIYNKEHERQAADLRSALDNHVEYSMCYPGHLVVLEEDSIYSSFIYDAVVVAPLSNQAISTSSKYEKFVVYSNTEEYLDYLQSLLDDDFSYSPLPEPDVTSFKYYRITDNNFVVKDFRISW